MQLFFLLLKYVLVSKKINTNESKEIRYSVKLSVNKPSLCLFCNLQFIRFILVRNHKHKLRSAHNTFFFISSEL